MDLFLFTVLTISWATSSGTSLFRSKENSMASLSLYFPANMLKIANQAITYSINVLLLVAQQTCALVFDQFNISEHI